MSRLIIPLLIMSLLFLLVECYAYQAFKTLVASKLWRRIWIVTAVIVYIQFYFGFYSLIKSQHQTLTFQYTFGILLLFLFPKLVLLITMFGEDIYRVFAKLFRVVTNADIKTIPGRRKFISQLAFGIAAIPFSSFLYGLIKGKYNYKVLKYEVAFEDLPDAFDGFTLTQISDIHSGSFTETEKVQYAIDLINEQQSDMLLFTGDIVNNKAEEMDNFIDMFASLKAPYGKFSVLGNHDYGDYAQWNSKAEKHANFEAIKNIHPKIGFELLLNESRYIEKNGEKIALVGVENWGNMHRRDEKGKGQRRKQKGDLNAASATIRKDDFKILMSHDPSHWDHEIKDHDFNYQLTLSGHTHGLQMGIEIPGFIKISPSRLFYKHWAGLYQEFGRYLYVNRGFGFHGFAGRAGIWPEITVFKLKKGTKNV